MVPSHLTVKKVSEILLFLNPASDQLTLTNKAVKFEMNESI